MRGIEPQQTGEMRVDAQPLRSKDAQNMRMSHQQHIVADVQQRQYPFDGVPVTRAASSTSSPGPLCTGTCSPDGNVSIQSPSSPGFSANAPSRIRPRRNRWPR